MLCTGVVVLSHPGNYIGIMAVSLFTWFQMVLCCVAFIKGNYLLNIRGCLLPFNYSCHNCQHNAMRDLE